MRNLLGIFCGCVLITIVACSKDNITPVVDASIQRAIDIALIDAYLESKGYTDIDTTDSGVRFVIIDEGAGERIEESDVVTFDYTGHLLSDTIFDTSIKSVVDSIRTVVIADSVGSADKFMHEILLSIFSEDRSHTPLTVTYSASGWPFDGRFIAGFSDGIAASFNSKNSEKGKKSVGIGGKVLLAIPSDLGYGALGSGVLIEPHAVVLFEMFPIKVTKQ